MRKLIYALILVFLLNSGRPAKATPFVMQLNNADGSPQTNVIQMTASPPVNTWTVVGTNIIYGSQVITLTPNASGFVSSNWCSPNVYQLLFPNLNTGFYVNVPNATNLLNLASCATNIPTISGTYLNGYGLVTNWLGFPPATNSNPGITAALAYVPATNSNSGIVAALGYTPATNSPTPWQTLSNPTNQYTGNTTYTNTSRKGWLTGWASGAVLNWTNSGSPFTLPVTNNFNVLIDTNGTFRFTTSGTLTNVLLVY